MAALQVLAYESMGLDLMGFENNNNYLRYLVKMKMMTDEQFNLYWP